MNLLEVSIHNIRIIRCLNMMPSRGVNILVGPNGSGKTSILEGIYLLGRGRSFRGRIYRTLITQDKNNCAVSALLSDGDGAQLRMGIERGKAGNRARIGNKKVKHTSELARNLPLLLLSPNSHSLLLKGAKERQHFLDWMLFHVEPTYLGLLYRYLRVLRQRNIVLRQVSRQNLLPAWDEELGNLGELIDRYRRKSVEILHPIFHNFLKDMLEVDVSMEYFSGWDKGKRLAEVLHNRSSSDEKLGYTLQGPHRGDLVFLVHGVPASQRLSRGEVKRLIFALILAQVRYLVEQANIIPVILIDELTAELDTQSIYAVFQMLSMLEAQVFVTAVSDIKINESVGYEAKMFHVEQGSIKSI